MNITKNERNILKGLHDLKPGEFICPRCHDFQLDSAHRFHPCKVDGDRRPLATMYIPNTGKQTANADPAYRKHAGSRPRRLRRTAVWITPTIYAGLGYS